MKIWKILVLVAGLAGIAGFFLPIVNYSAQGASSLSAFDIVRGAGTGGDIIDKAKTVGTTYEVSKEMTQKLDSQVETGLAALKGIIIGLFVPAFILAVMGGIGVARGRFQRLSGIFSLILGIVSAAIWGVFFLGSSDAGDYSVGLGLHMLLAAGLGGIIGGIGAIIKPDGDRWTGV